MSERRFTFSKGDFMDLAQDGEHEDLWRAYSDLVERLEQAEAERDELRALVAEAYPGEQPTNGWRARAEKLNAWPGAA